MIGGQRKALSYRDLQRMLASIRGVGDDVAGMRQSQIADFNAANGPTTTTTQTVDPRVAAYNNARGSFLNADVARQNWGSAVQGKADLMKGRLDNAYEFEQSGEHKFIEVQEPGDPQRTQYYASQNPNFPGVLAGSPVYASRWRSQPSNSYGVRVDNNTLLSPVGIDVADSVAKTQDMIWLMQPGVSFLTGGNYNNEYDNRPTVYNAPIANFQPESGGSENISTELGLPSEINLATLDQSDPRLALNEKRGRVALKNARMQEFDPTNIRTGKYAALLPDRLRDRLQESLATQAGTGSNSTSVNEQWVNSGSSNAISPAIDEFIARRNAQIQHDNSNIEGLRTVDLQTVHPIGTIKETQPFNNPVPSKREFITSPDLSSRANIVRQMYGQFADPRPTLTTLPTASGTRTETLTTSRQANLGGLSFDPQADKYQRKLRKLVRRRS